MDDERSATLVLIHGGGHGGWCWRPCANVLRAHGHEVYAPTLTGFGDRAHVTALGFDTFVSDIVLLDTVPQSPWIAKAVAIGPDGTAHTDPELILDTNIHDGSPEQREFVRARHRPYPPFALVEPGPLSQFLELGLPTGYVVATLDRTIEPHVQEQFASRLPGHRRAEVAAGHDCMITRPAETAAAIEAVLP